jgi:hypothetical protein
MTRVALFVVIGVALGGAACTEFDVAPAGGGGASAASTTSTSTSSSTSAGSGGASPRCADGVRDGAETDVDCGGPDCSPCADHMTCARATDCASGRCDQGACVATTCSDGIANGGETDVDCGGPCAPCSDGLACLAGGDCDSEVCGPELTCIGSPCSNGVIDPGETDVDCGGRCRPCALGAACVADLDCIAGGCVRGRCEAPVGVWQTAPAGPPARAEHEMTYDAASGGVLLYGGIDGTNVDDDTWSYDGATWREIAPTGPGGRAFPLFVGTGASVLLFGGENGGYLADTWSLTSGVWTFTLPAGVSPYGRVGSQNGVVDGVPFFFGGYGPPDGATAAGVLADTWVFSAGAWAQAAGGPSARYGGAIASGGAVAYLFGGTPDGQASLDETWAWNGGGWVDLTTATRPPARFATQMAFDAVRGRVVLFGGLSRTEDVLAETWEFDGATWARTTTTGPSMRYWAAMTFDPSRGRTVLFGGFAPGGASVLGDAWEYHVVGNACQETAGCDTAFCVDGVCCETASCGTCAACNLPSSPGSCAPVINATDPDSCAGTCDATGACE